MAKTIKTKRLIYCPVCLSRGRINVLGELTDNGFVVKRFHNGETIIQGTNFAVICGTCKELILFRRKNESVDSGLTGMIGWLYVINVISNMIGGMDGEKLHRNIQS